MANGMVKTYRVLRDGLKVGHDVRSFGDYMPEAAEFDNLRSLLNADFLEEVWVEESVLEEWKEEYAQRSLATEADEEDEETPETDEDEGKSEPDPDADVVVEPKKPSKKIKRKTVKKTQVKENGNALAEQSV